MIYYALSTLNILDGRDLTVAKNARGRREINRRLTLPSLFPTSSREVTLPTSMSLDHEAEPQKTDHPGYMSKGILSSTSAMPKNSPFYAALWTNQWP